METNLKTIKMTKDKRVDTYIAKSANFARPILHHLRSLVHEACPDVEEIIKWSFPNFSYKGMLCSMASFKQHCAFTFWKGALMKDAGQLIRNNKTAMGHLGKIGSLKDLPPDKKIISMIKEAMKLNENDIKLPARRKTISNKEIEIPAGLQNELKKNKDASTIFNNFSPTHKREYIEWINEAKTEATIMKRIETTIEWIMEGKSRNWKYMKK
jgi:uncharacterized protein YdeI (YjbR/CyaY-like superfamily)